ncbi:uncharacterized protein BDZ99DRAFT_230839 [Mytilinidion resinicola]|uniref:Uncharacterized protein n=1 Tax=Mytilinidion resinicola TaxID=574789 RepID=A0A6A6YZ08_9PEZI|nr:uncharacterized protein BDZ99DRAFT_230839 [Mytilinidion resinicola]KAF2814061.1 hypothetical protein BDZ99DRAFT_230839 [Mytilinidion resinicola]
MPPLHDDPLLQRHKLPRQYIGMFGEPEGSDPGPSLSRWDHRLRRWRRCGVVNLWSKASRFWRRFSASVRPLGCRRAVSGALVALVPAYQELRKAPRL